MQALEAMVSRTEGTKFLPLSFKVTRSSLVQVVFNRKSELQSSEKFLVDNPILNLYNKDPLAGLEGDSDIPINIVSLSENDFETMPYIDYIAAVIELYGMLCLNRN